MNDPQTGKDYYTRMITDRTGGAIAFEDARTGKDVVLQNSEVTRIDRDVYEMHADREPALDLDDDDIVVSPAGGHTDGDRQIEIHRGDQDLHIDTDDDSDVQIKVD